ncbi:MAG: hypothetical protein ACRCYY_16200 [Trueperaceae bacterium]
MKWILILVVLMFGSLLSACAPRAEAKPVGVQQFAGEVSYYPREAGATWEYIAENELTDAPRLQTQVLGPTVINGDIWVVTRSVGKGLDLTWYRQYRPEGVFLLREERPGMQLTYDPPLQEMPAENSLRVGSTWTGDSTVTVFYPDAKKEEDRKQTYTFNYSYTVVDQRDINVGAGEFNVFVINFVARTTNEEGEEQSTDTQETWFAPNIGEIRTENGYFLIDTNVR